jgi:23S rRNA (pseudouridine1915-N3)-methyltransferase
MRLIVSAIGQRMPDWVNQGWVEYARRFPRGLSLELRELAAAKRGRNANPDSLRKTESAALMASVPDGFRVIALDERGESWSTANLAERLERWMQEEHGICFLVGGPDGMSRDCRAAANDRWSLSRLTLPHPMVRIILAEQLYRAWTVTANHPYHRA